MLAELCRRDLVPAVWVASLGDRAIRERLRRRAHLVKQRTSARNRIFGLLTQFGCGSPSPGCASPERWSSSSAGVPAVWRDSIAEHLDQIDALQRGSARSTRELAPLARSDPAREAAATIPGVGPPDRPHLRLGDRRRLALFIASKLVGYSGLAPRIIQSGDRSATGRAIEGRLADASLGRGRGGQPGLAPDQPVPRPLPPTGRPPRHQPGEVSVARKLLICAWHMLSRDEPLASAHQRLPRQAPAAFRPPDGPAWN